MATKKLGVDSLTCRCGSGRSFLHRVWTFNVGVFFGTRVHLSKKSTMYVVTATLKASSTNFRGEPSTIRWKQTISTQLFMWLKEWLPHSPSVGVGEMHWPSYCFSKWFWGKTGTRGQEGRLGEKNGGLCVVLISTRLFYPYYSFLNSHKSLKIQSFNLSRKIYDETVSLQGIPLARDGSTAHLKPNVLSRQSAIHKCSHQQFSDSLNILIKPGWGGIGQNPFRVVCSSHHGLQCTQAAVVRHKHLDAGTSSLCWFTKTKTKTGI